MRFPRRPYRMFPRIKWAVLLVLTVAFGLAQAGAALAIYDGGSLQSESTAPAAAAPATGKVVRVDMNDMLRFVEPEVRIKAGDTVEWRNVGGFPHTVTADPRKAANPANVSLPAGAAPFDSGAIRGGKTFRLRFTKPGVYSYVCLPHERAGMLGRVIVE